MCGMSGIFEFMAAWTMAVHPDDVYNPSSFGWQSKTPAPAGLGPKLLSCGNLLLQKEEWIFRADKRRGAVVSSNKHV